MNELNKIYSKVFLVIWNNALPAVHSRASRCCSALGQRSLGLKVKEVRGYPGHWWIPHDASANEWCQQVSHWINGISVNCHKTNKQYSNVEYFIKQLSKRAVNGKTNQSKEACLLAARKLNLNSGNVTELEWRLLKPVSCVNSFTLIFQVMKRLFEWQVELQLNWQIYWIVIPLIGEIFHSRLLKGLRQSVPMHQRFHMFTLCLVKWCTVPWRSLQFKIMRISQYLCLPQDLEIAWQASTDPPVISRFDKHVLKIWCLFLTDRAKILKFYAQLFLYPLGLALLTLSWDKNWDSHSPMNGYPSFYPRIALVAPSPAQQSCWGYIGFIIPLAQWSCWGILSSLCLSIRPSVCPSVHRSRIPCPLCNFYSSGWILPILGTNDP